MMHVDSSCILEQVKVLVLVLLTFSNAYLPDAAATLHCRVHVHAVFKQLHC